MKPSLEIRCPDCGEVITNPICEECLLEEINSWLGYSGKKLTIDLNIFHDTNNYFNDLIADSKEHTKCIICGKPIIHCNFCTLTLFKEQIKMQDLNLLDSFRDHFGDLELEKEIVIH